MRNWQLTSNDQAVDFLASFILFALFVVAVAVLAESRQREFPRLGDAGAGPGRVPDYLMENLSGSPNG